METLRLSVFSAKLLGRKVALAMYKVLITISYPTSINGKTCVVMAQAGLGIQTKTRSPRTIVIIQSRAHQISRPHSPKTKTSYNFHTQTAAFAFSTSFTSFLHFLIHFTPSELVANTHWSRQVAALALGSTGLLMRVGPGNCLISNNAFVDGCLKKKQAVRLKLSLVLKCRVSQVVNWDQSVHTYIVGKHAFQSTKTRTGKTNLRLNSVLPKFHLAWHALDAPWDKPDICLPYPRYLWSVKEMDLWMVVDALDLQQKLVQLHVSKWEFMRSRHGGKGMISLSNITQKTCKNDDPEQQGCRECIPAMSIMPLLQGSTCVEYYGQPLHGTSRFQSPLIPSQHIPSK